MEWSNKIMTDIKKYPVFYNNEEYEIFTKYYYEEKKIKQIAKELNLSTSNVKTKLHRTREKLKKILRIGGF